MSTLLPSTNAEGLSVVPMSDEHKYFFDLRGWICLKGLLTSDQVESIREHQLKFHFEPESLPVEERNTMGGPSQILLDHPVVVGVLNEILAEERLKSEDCYGFRFERARTDYRERGDGSFKSHGGGGYFNFCGDSHMYQMLPNKIYSGLTRVVWEMHDVEKGDGGTLLLSGSHKSAFEKPDAVYGEDSEMWDTYSCPAGSVLIFTESLCHSGTTWTNESVPRLSVFTLYNTVNNRWGRCSVPQCVVETMPYKRQTLFRDAWVTSLAKDEDAKMKWNKYYDAENYAF